MAQDSAYPLISVIFPVYNVEKWVEESLASVCSQTYENLEIIVVNDGSTDGSAAICSRMAETDHRVRLFDQDNMGLSGARNRGMNEANGEYLLFVDSDDVLCSEHVMLLYSCLVRHNVDIALTTMTDFAEHFDREMLQVGEEEVLSSTEAIEIMFYQGRFDSCAQSKLFKKGLWEGIEFPLSYLHEDLPTTYRVFQKTSSVAFFPSTSYGYRRNLNGINHSVTKEEKVKTLLLLDKMVDSFSAAQSDLTDAAVCLRQSFAFHLLLNATEDSIGDDSRRRIQKTIVENRVRVIRDNRARTKTRIASAATFLGWSATAMLFRLAKRG